MTSLLLWLLILYAPLGLLQLFMVKRRSRRLPLYQRVLIIVFFVAGELLATAYVSGLFFDLIRDKGLRCATGVVGLWALAFGAMGFGLGILSQSAIQTRSPHN